MTQSMFDVMLMGFILTCNYKLFICSDFILCSSLNESNAMNDMKTSQIYSHIFYCTAGEVLYGETTTESCDLKCVCHYGVCFGLLLMRAHGGSLTLIAHVQTSAPFDDLDRVVSG